MNSTAESSRMHANSLNYAKHVMGLYPSLLKGSRVMLSARSTSCRPQVNCARTRLVSTLCCTSRAFTYAGTCNDIRLPFSRRIHATAKSHMSWMPKFGPHKQYDQFSGPMDNQEEATKVAILDKVMKGRQPTDLMLRCKFRPVNSQTLSA